MAEKSFRLPVELIKKLDTIAIDWSARVQKFLEQELNTLANLDGIITQRQLSEQDARKMSVNVSKKKQLKGSRILYLVIDSNVIFSVLIKPAATYFSVDFFSELVVTRR